MGGRKQLTTENTELAKPKAWLAKPKAWDTEGRAELEEQKEGPEEMERHHFLRPAWFLPELELCALCALCGEGIGREGI